MKKRSEMKKRVLLSNISEPIKTKASEKIVNHPFQFMTFKETQIIKDAYKEQESLNFVLSHSKLSDNNIENCGNIIETIAISETNSSHKKKWEYNKRQSAQGCILVKNVISPTKEIKASKERLQLVNSNKNNTCESIPNDEHGNDDVLFLLSSSKYPQNSLNEPNTTVTDDLISSYNYNKENENRIRNGSRVQRDVLKALFKLRQALVCRSQNSKKEKSEECLGKPETDNHVDIISPNKKGGAAIFEETCKNHNKERLGTKISPSNPTICDTERNTDSAESHDLNRIIEKSEAQYKKRRLKTLKKGKDRVKIGTKLGFTNIYISSGRRRQYKETRKERIKEECVDSADDSDLPLSDLKRKLQKENVQVEKKTSNVSLDDIRQIIPKRKLQREVEDLMAQEDYISNVSGHDVSFLNGERNRRSTEEEIVTFILKKYVKKFKIESNIATNSPVAENLDTKELSSPPEKPITTFKAHQSLSCRVLQKIDNECVQPEESRRQQTVSKKKENRTILAKEENIFTRNEGKRRQVNECLTENENTRRKRKQRRKSLLAETFNENVSLEDASSAEEEAVSEETLIKFNKLSINIPWEVPPLHRIETIVTRAPLRHQQKRIADLNVEIKKGAFDKMEDNKIKENWRKFCALHELPSNPTLFMSGTPIEKIASLSYTQKLQFVQFLAHGLENRLLHSVYMRFQRLFLKRKSGRFSREEDEIIMEYMKTTKSNHQFLDLGHILKRDKLAVEKRYICIKNREKSNNIIKWDKKAIANFLNNLLEIVKCSQIERLKTQEIKLTEWLELSQKLNIPTNKLRRVWRYTIYPRLFMEHSVNSKRIKRNLVDLLSDSNEYDWRNLNWNRIAEQFKGFTGEKLYLMFKNMVNYHVPSAIQGNLHECLEYLQALDFQTCMYPSRKIKKVKVVQTNSIQK